MSNQAVIHVMQCKVEPVGSCPNTPDSWNAAAQRKNCSTDLCGSKSVYHCLLTEERQLVEVCAKPINLHGKTQLSLWYTYYDKWSIPSQHVLRPPPPPDLDLAMLKTHVVVIFFFIILANITLLSNILKCYKILFYNISN